MNPFLEALNRAEKILSEKDAEIACLRRQLSEARETGGKPYCVHGIADYDLCKVCNPGKGRF